jgi:hypothetical protein
MNVGLNTMEIAEKIEAKIKIITYKLLLSKLTFAMILSNIEK